jgi:hypothetical protein
MQKLVKDTQGYETAADANSQPACFRDLLSVYTETG